MSHRQRWIVLGAVVLTSVPLAFAGLQAPRLAVPPRGALLADVTVVRPGAGRLPGQTLVVEEGRIARIRDVRPDDPRDGYAGSFVLPGLVDLHVHHPPAWAPGERELYALLFLAHGVTSVRDTGRFFGSLAGLRRRIEAGQLPGPRLFRCGPMVDGEASTWPGARRVRGREQGRRVVESLAAEGVDCIKVYNAIRWDAYRGVQEAAAEAGLPVVAHRPRRVALSALGPAEVQHLMGVSRSWLEVSDREIERYVAVSVKRELTHTPTLVAFARWARIEDPASLARDPAVALLPPHYPELVWDPERNPLVRQLMPTKPAEIGPRVPAMQQVIRALHAADVPVLVGTDTGNPFVVPGAAVHDELRLLVEAGLTPEQAWAAGTRRAGEALRRAGLGTVQEGAPADLLVFRRDPTRDLEALGSLEAVVGAGRLYARADLEAATGRWRDHLRGRLRRIAAGAMARAGLVWLRLSSRGPES